MKYLKITFFIVCLALFSLTAQAQSAEQPPMPEVPEVKVQTLAEIQAEQALAAHRPSPEELAPEYTEAELELIRLKEQMYAEEARKEQMLESKEAKSK